MLSLHAELAREIAEQIEGALTAVPQQRLSPTRAVDPAAYEAFLKGRYFSGLWPEIPKAIEYFERAIRVDPDFAPAHAGLAICYMNLALFALLPPQEILPPLERSVTAALDLDPNSSDAHLARGADLGLGKRDPLRAAQALRQAIALDPNNAYARAHTVDI